VQIEARATAIVLARIVQEFDKLAHQHSSLNLEDDQSEDTKLFTAWLGSKGIASEDHTNIILAAVRSRIRKFVGSSAQVPLTVSRFIDLLILRVLPFEVDDVEDTELTTAATNTRASLFGTFDSNPLESPLEDEPQYSGVKGLVNVLRSPSIFKVRAMNDFDDLGSSSNSQIDDTLPTHMLNPLNADRIIGSVFSSAPVHSVDSNVEKHLWLRVENVEESDSISLVTFSSFKLSTGAPQDGIVSFNGPFHFSDVGARGKAKIVQIELNIETARNIESLCGCGMRTCILHADDAALVDSTGRTSMEVMKLEESKAPPASLDEVSVISVELSPDLHTVQTINNAADQNVIRVLATGILFDHPGELSAVQVDCTKLYLQSAQVYHSSLGSDYARVQLDCVSDRISIIPVPQPNTISIEIPLTLPNVRSVRQVCGVRISASNLAYPGACYLTVERGFLTIADGNQNVPIPSTFAMMEQATGVIVDPPKLVAFYVHPNGHMVRMFFDRAINIFSLDCSNADFGVMTDTGDAMNSQSISTHDCNFVEEGKHSSLDHHSNANSIDSNDTDEKQSKGYAQSVLLTGITLSEPDIHWGVSLAGGFIAAASGDTKSAPTSKPVAGSPYPRLTSVCMYETMREISNGFEQSTVYISFTFKENRGVPAINETASLPPAAMDKRRIDVSKISLSSNGQRLELDSRKKESLFDFYDICDIESDLYR
jgi:hypothetical protein